MEKLREIKEENKKTERVLKRWQKLVTGVRLRQRLKMAYPLESAVEEQVSQMTRDTRLIGAWATDLVLLFAGDSQGRTRLALAFAILLLLL